MIGGTARQNRGRDTRRVGVLYIGTTERKRSGFGMVEWKSDISKSEKIISIKEFL